jgi:anthranilate phosphoribosyltransferase
MKEFTKKAENRQDLSREEAYRAMLRILEHASDIDIHDFLVAMNEKEITVDELTGFAIGMREKAGAINPHVDLLVDTCGTGGDCKGTINISTGAAIVAASAGVYIAKHGNYSVSSRCGSANILEEMGYNLGLAPEQCREMIEQTGFGFLFAPRFHPAMKKVAAVRAKIGKKTIFNLLGPLCNPANAQAQLIGVYDRSLCEKFCYVLKELGVEHALVVHGSGLDEISNIGESIVYELKKGKIKSYEIKPEDFGFHRYQLEDILGGNSKENAEELNDIFDGKKGAKRDVIALNAGAAIYLGKKASSIEEGIIKAEETLDSGKARDKLLEIIEYSRK